MNFNFNKLFSIEQKEEEILDINKDIKNITIALDLDGTLISQVHLDKFDKYINIKIKLLDDNFELLYEYTDKYGVDLIYIRPRVIEFIKEIKQFANVIVFTAREEKSACEIVKFLDPTNELIEDIYDKNSLIPFKHILPGVKDLQVVSFKHEFINMNNIILIDDWWDTNNYLQIFNFLPIKKWNLELFYSSHLEQFNNENYINSLINDNYLFDVILPFLREAQYSNDIRSNIIQFHKANSHIYGEQLINCINKVKNIIKDIEENNLHLRLHENRMQSFIKSLNKKYKIKNNQLINNRIYYRDTINEMNYSIDLYYKNFT
jgi:hypothetical protein